MMNYSWGEVSGEALDVRPPQSASVCMIARAEAMPGKGAELERLLNEFADDVRAERGCLAYTVTKPVGSSTHFAVHARFAGWRAFCRHGVTPHMRRAMPALMAKLASAVSLEVFLEV